jgi:hypothetical protein
MDLHPILVHLPIAWLALYTGIEVISSFSQWVKEKLINTKIFLLLVGVIGTFMALQTGEIAEHMMWGRSNLVEVHSTFANLTHFSYMIIAIIYALILIINNKIWEKYRTTITKNYLPKIKNFLNNIYTHYIIIILSIMWFFFLSITGALWGAITHGTADDPVSAWAVNIFVEKQ